ncbi:MAG: hypothetical protein AAF572_28700, partial [Cyanobacteria bacterium P01_B01_bin.77]
QHLPEGLLPEALEVTRQLNDESYREIALGAIAQHLPEGLLPEALEVTRQLNDESYRALALGAIAQHLPEGLLPEALDTIWNMKDKYYCASALQNFLSYLEQRGMLFPEWSRVLETLAYQNRNQLISALPKMRPALVRLSSEQMFSMALQAVRDVCQQWP